MWMVPLLLLQAKRSGASRLISRTLNCRTERAEFA